MRRGSTPTVIAAGAVFVAFAVVGAVGAGVLLRPSAPGPSSSPGPSTTAEAVPVLTPTPSATRLASPSAPPAAGRGAAAGWRGWSLAAGWTVAVECDDEGERCVVTRHGPDGASAPGWPVSLPDGCFGPPVTGPDESVFVACDAGAQTIVVALGRDGRALPGWPVTVKGELAWSSWGVSGLEGGPALAVGPDGTVYAGTDGGRFRIHAFDQAGAKRRGWPVTLAGVAQGFLVAPSGTVAAWWYEGVSEGLGVSARRTVFTMLDERGRTLDGWPIGSKGTASSPVAWDDDSLYYTSASGKVYGHDRMGRVLPGWPVKLPEQVAPVWRADGRLLFVGWNRVDVLDRQGRVVAGWPHRVKGGLLGAGCDMDGYAMPAWDLDNRDRLILAASDGEARSTILRLEADGRMSDGWPVLLPEGWVPTWVAGDGSGGATVEIMAECELWEQVAITASGELAAASLPTPMSVVYGRLRPSAGPNDDRPGWSQGSQIQLEVALTNRGDEPVVLPRQPIDEEELDGEPYQAGRIWAWLKRLGPDPTLTCLPGAPRRGDWHLVSDWLFDSDAPLVIPPDESVSTWKQVVLPPELTTCLPAGDYRVRVEYQPLWADVEESEPALGATAVDLRIVPAAPTVTPDWLPSGPPSASSPSPTRAPTPRPSPSPSPSPSPTWPPGVEQPSPT